MKIEWNRKYTTIALYVIITSVILAMLFAAFSNFGAVREFFDTLNSILFPVYIGFAVAYLANPIMKISEKHIFRFKVTSNRRFNVKRGLSIALSLIVLLIIVTILFLLLIPQLFLSLSDLISKMSGYIDKTVIWLGEFLPADLFNESELTLETFYNSILEYLKTSEFTTEITKLTEGIGQLSGNIDKIITGSITLIKDYVLVLLSYFTGFANGILNVVLGIFFAIYMLSSKEKLIAQLKKVLRAFTTEKMYNNVVELAIFSNKTFGGYLIGKIVDSTIVGIVMFIACSIAKIPYPLLLSAFVGITNVIPVIGPFIGAIPGVLIIFIVDPSKVLLFVIFNIVIQQIDGNIIGPKILGESTGLSSLWVLFAITVLGGIWGLFGMFISVPIFAILYKLVKLLIEKILRDKQLATETLEYYTDNEIRDFPDHDTNKHSFAARMKDSSKTMDKQSFITKLKTALKRKKKNCGIQSENSEPNDNSK